MNRQAMEQILNKIKEYDRIILFRHKRPDGDAVGSTLGLREILRLTYPQKEILIINSDYSDYMSFLGKEDEDRPDAFYAEALGIVIDTATAERISNPKYTLCRELCKIDHHIDIKPYGDYCWIEEERSSACEMIATFYDTFREELQINKAAATYIYTGMVTDSGSTDTSCNVPRPVFLQTLPEYLSSRKACSANFVELINSKRPSFIFVDIGIWYFTTSCATAFVQKICNPSSSIAILQNIFITHFFYTKEARPLKCVASLFIVVTLRECS